jgi:hypothetical protein
VILNAGANDLAKAGSTQEKAAGPGNYYYIAEMVRDLASEIKNNSNISVKVGILTPVYRGDLNDIDQSYLRSEIKSGSYSTAPDCIKDSWDGIKDTYTALFTDNKLNNIGYYVLNEYVMQILMTNMSPP